MGDGGGGRGRCALPCLPDAQRTGIVVLVIGFRAGWPLANADADAHRHGQAGSLD